MVHLQFVGLDSPGPREFAILTPIAARLEFVFGECGQEDLIVPNARGRRRPRHLNLPQHRIRRTDLGGWFGVGRDARAVRPAKGGPGRSRALDHQGRCSQNQEKQCTQVHKLKRRRGQQRELEVVFCQFQPCRFPYAPFAAKPGLPCEITGAEATLFFDADSLRGRPAIATCWILFLNHNNLAFPVRRLVFLNRVSMRAASAGLRFSTVRYLFSASVRSVPIRRQRDTNELLIVSSVNIFMSKSGGSPGDLSTAKRRGWLDQL